MHAMTLFTITSSLTALAVFESACATTPAPCECSHAPAEGSPQASPDPETLDFGPARFDGLCDREQTTRVVGRKRLWFMACYGQRLKVVPPFQGTVNLRWTIDEQGHVDSPGFVGAELADRETSNCLLRTAKTLQFEPQSARCTVMVPMTFATTRTESPAAARERQVADADPGDSGGNLACDNYLKKVARCLAEAPEIRESMMDTLRGHLNSDRSRFDEGEMTRQCQNALHTAMNAIGMLCPHVQW